MVKQSDYFLWLTPAESALRELQTLIDSLAKEYGGPSFEPHITLLSRLAGSAAEIETSVAELADCFVPLSVRCPTLGWSDEYYRCLYLNVEGDTALVSVYDRASARIPHALSKDFQPHISIAYGNLTESTKLEIAAALDGRYPTTLVVDRLSLYHAPGGPETWRRVRAFELA
jgi:2'-5' RNA ligase